MKTIYFPYIALTMGVTFMLIISMGSQTDNSGATVVPLLTLLVMNEFAFIANLVGGYIGIKHTISVGAKPVYTTATIVCVLLAVRFLLLGIDLWSNTF